MSLNLDLGLTREIIEVCKIRRHSLQSTAYILATAYWESGRTMQPVEEGFYLKDPKAFQKKLKYYPWFGRGLVQITWKDNYVKAGKRLGTDFTKDPNKVMEPFYAVRILVVGMEEGWFTGKDVDDYIDDIDESDEEDYKEYLEARRTVNGVDKKAEIAKLALEYEALLKAEGEIVTPDPEPLPPPPDIPKPVPTPEVVDPWWLTALRILRKVLFR